MRSLTGKPPTKATAWCVIGFSSKQTFSDDSIPYGEVEFEHPKQQEHSQDDPEKDFILERNLLVPDDHPNGCRESKHKCEKQ